jgi:hypothetical protein
MTSIPFPAGLPLDAASWYQILVVVCQLVVQLLAIIQRQAARIAALEARVSQNSHNSDRPPWSDPPHPRCRKMGAFRAWCSARPGCGS